MFGPSVNCAALCYPVTKVLMLIPHLEFCVTVRPGDHEVIEVMTSHIWISSGSQGGMTLESSDSSNSAYEDTPNCD
jgi:hypothetical protein